MPEGNSLESGGIGGGGASGGTGPGGQGDIQNVVLSNEPLGTDFTPLDQGEPANAPKDELKKDEGGIPEQMKAMKSHFDSKIAEQSKQFEQALASKDEEIKFLREQVTKNLALGNQQGKGQPPQNQQNTPQDNQSSPGQPKSDLQRFLESLPEEQREQLLMNEGQKSVFLSQIGGDIREMISEVVNSAIEPIKQAQEKQVKEEIEPVKQMLAESDKRTMNNTWNQATGSFTERYPEANDQRISAKLMEVVSRDPRVGGLLRAGDVDAVSEIFEGYLLTRFNQLRTEILNERKAEEEAKATAEKLQQSQSPTGPSGLPIPKTGAEAYMQAYQQLNG